MEKELNKDFYTVIIFENHYKDTIMSTYRFPLRFRKGDTITATINGISAEDATVALRFKGKKWWEFWK